MTEGDYAGGAGDGPAAAPAYDDPAAPYDGHAAAQAAYQSAQPQPVSAYAAYSHAPYEGQGTAPQNTAYQGQTAYQAAYVGYAEPHAGGDLHYGAAAASPPNYPTHGDRTAYGGHQPFPSEGA